MNEDLISRSVAKDEIFSLAVIINKPHLLSKEDTLYVLDTLPAVDAEAVFEAAGLVKDAFDMAKSSLVSVVRCGQCIHRADPKRISCKGRSKDWFCADGEKESSDGKI